MSSRKAIWMRCINKLLISATVRQQSKFYRKCTTSFSEKWPSSLVFFTKQASVRRAETSVCPRWHQTHWMFHQGSCWSGWSPRSSLRTCLCVPWTVASCQTNGVTMHCWVRQETDRHTAITVCQRVKTFFKSSYSRTEEKEMSTILGKTFIWLFSRVRIFYWRDLDPSFTSEGHINN